MERAATAHAAHSEEKIRLIDLKKSDSNEALRRILEDIRDIMNFNLFTVRAIDGKREINISRPPLYPKWKSEFINRGTQFKTVTIILLSPTRKEFKEDINVKYYESRAQMWVFSERRIRQFIACSYYRHMYIELERAMATAYRMQPNLAFSFAYAPYILPSHNADIRTVFERAINMIEHFRKNLRKNGYDLNCMVVPSCNKGLHFHAVGRVLKDGNVVQKTEEVLSIFETVFDLELKKTNPNVWTMKPKFYTKHLDSSKQSHFHDLCLYNDYELHREKCEGYNISYNVWYSMKAKPFTTSFTPRDRLVGGMKSRRKLFRIVGRSDYYDDRYIVSKETMDLLIRCIDKVLSKELLTSDDKEMNIFNAEGQRLCDIVTDCIDSTGEVMSVEVV